MNFTNALRIITLGAILAVGSPAALAKAKATPQSHHCKLQDGSMDMKQTKKQCLAGKGTWAKDVDAPAAPVASTPAAAPK